MLYLPQIYKQKAMIGLYDSGYGGLTVMKHVMEALPEYDYLYLGDNLRSPYGSKNAEQLIEISERAVEHLFAKGVTLIIVACNTLSAVSLRHLQEKYLRTPNVTDKKILGVIRPTVEKAATLSQAGRIGVVGTRATISSEVYSAELKKINPELTVFSKACPLLVPLIEEKWHQKPEAKMILKKYLHPLKSTQIDSLILGCTHYPFMKKSFEHCMGKRINVLESGPIVADSLKDYLSRHPEIETQLTKGGTKKYLTTGSVDDFKEVSARFLGVSEANVEHVHF